MIFKKGPAWALFVVLGERFFRSPKTLLRRSFSR